MSRQDVLVTTDWAEKNLNTDGIVFIEVDEVTTAYEGGHIPGAIRLDWTDELTDPVRRDILSKEDFAATLSRKGVRNDDTVVLYGGNNNWFAAYAYWEFKLYGHANLKLIDGGRKKWELEGRTLTTDVPERPATTYEAKDADLSIRAFRDEVLEAIGKKNLVDVRSPDEFSGKIFAPAHLPQEVAQRAGHITTAINIPWSKAANDDGTFKSDEELTALYREAGLDPSKPTIAYCRIGERSSHSWLVLHELLGYRDVKNYDGSWAEYGSLVGVPIELGAAS
jgi:thiosulfate/3-mercaptopyruvate sulfurtransferase